MDMGVKKAVVDWQERSDMIAPWVHSSISTNGPFVLTTISVYGLL